jgi:hypothetical protein
MGKVYINKEQEKDIREFIVELSTLKNRAAELEMWRTFHELDETLNQAGWELARLLGEERYK